jgi:ATP-dependent Clp protease ATP-binding subunit ClpC
MSKIKSKFNRLINELKENPEEIQQKEKTETVLLDNLGRDLTVLAKENKFDPTIGRTKEMDEVISILARRRKNNPVLIGDPGVGKTAIVEGIAQIIANDKECPDILKGKRIIELDMATIMSGTSNQGDLEKKVKRIIKELADNPDVILFIDEIHMIVDPNKPIDVSNMFKPALARGEMRCIGATTEKEYKQIERDGALERRFQKVMVVEPSQSETIEILKRLKDNYGKFHGVEYSDDAVVTCVKLAGRYITDRFFPDKAIDLLDEVGARARAKATKSEEVKNLEKELHKVGEAKNAALKAQKYEESSELRRKEKELQEKLTELNSREKNKIKITKADVERVMARKIDVPELKSDDDDIAKKYLDLEKNLKMDIIGQDEVVSKVSKCLRRNASGLKDTNRPQGVFLFLGSTGTGKTHTVKTLAKNIFGSESAMIRIDMSEYGEKHNVSRMIGSPPGYVGYGEGGQLTEKVRRKPYSIILLDEIEKAHPNVLNIFLQVFEDGHLTDGQGRKVDFKNTIIVMTSNVGSKAASEAPIPVGFNNKSLAREEKTKDIIKKELQSKFTPEFLNRIDDIIVFSKLSKENIHQIIDVETRKLASKLADMGYTLELTTAMKDFLSENGYDSEMGARPLRRAITKWVEDPISEELLRKTIKDKILVDYDTKKGKVLINGNQIIEKKVLSWKLFKM